MSESEGTSRLDDDGASYMMSVADIMSGLLFVFVITLMAFVLNFQQAQREAQEEQTRSQEERDRLEEQQIALREDRDRVQEERDSLRESLRESDSLRASLQAQQDSLQTLVDVYSGIEDLRARMLRELEEELEARNIQVSVDYDQGILRLDDRAIEFETAASTLGERARENAAVIADVLESVVPCYTKLSEAEVIQRGCDLQTLNTLEAVFIEGHTDNRPMIRDGEDQNWELSAARAIRAYREFERLVPQLVDLVNQDGQRVLSVAGYGPSRPLPGRDYAVPTADEQNRRIDLRFIMEPPDTDDPELIEALRREGAE